MRRGELSRFGEGGEGREGGRKGPELVRHNFVWGEYHLSLGLV